MASNFKIINLKWLRKVGTLQEGPHMSASMSCKCEKYIVFELGKGRQWCLPNWQEVQTKGNTLFIEKWTLWSFRILFTIGEEGGPTLLCQRSKEKWSLWETIFEKIKLIWGAGSGVPLAVTE